jgi:hypothetical protein
MKTKFKKQPMCELLGNVPAEHFTFRRGKWFFVSTEAPEDWNEYHFEIDRFFCSPASIVDWLAHLSEKSWFDAADFCTMIHRFRKATGSFFELDSGFWDARRWRPSAKSREKKNCASTPL